MSLCSRSGTASGRPPGSSVYRESFLRDVYRLIAHGYLSLTLEDLAEKEEPAITGLLVAAIEGVLDDPRSPDWVERYAIQEEKPIQEARPLKEGKSRHRVDIEIESSGRRPRPRFQLEAKRLRETDSKSTSSYLGSEGLGCFLTGRYAGTYGQAGMLGYVQTGSESSWASGIHEKLRRNAVRYQLAGECDGLRRHRLVSKIEHSYLSSHVRRGAGEIEIHHILLCCHGPSAACCPGRPQRVPLLAATRRGMR